MEQQEQNARYYKTKGKFYWGNRSEQWQVVLWTSAGQVSALWDEEDEPEIGDMLPTEVLSVIEERIKSYWIYTGRDEDLAKVARIREQGAALDTVWVQKKLQQLATEVERWQDVLRGLAHPPKGA
jgi:hypothetical protein